MTSAYTIACHRCGTLVDLDDIDECGSCIACAERLREPSALERFRANDRRVLLIPERAASSNGGAA